MSSETTEVTFKVFVAVVLLSFTDLLCTSLCSAGQVYPEFAVNVIKNVEKILIEKGICLSNDDCNRKEIVKYGGSDTNFSIYLHEYEKIDTDSINAILALLFDTYRKNNNIDEIALKLRKDKIEGYINANAFRKPEMTISINGRKKSWLFW